MLNYKTRRKQKRILRETAMIALGLVQEHLWLQQVTDMAVDHGDWDEFLILEDERDAWQAQCEMVSTVIHSLGE